VILLWGTMEDDPLAMTHEALVQAGADFVFLDHRQIFSSEIDYSFGSDASERCVVTQGEQTIDLARVTVAYPRGSDIFDYDELENKPMDDPLTLRAMAFEAILMAYLDSSDALVINRSEPAASNNSKPYQLSVIRRSGLLVPETFISNRRTDAEEFLSRYPDSIFKSISGVRSIVRRVSADHREALDDVDWCPTLFQRVVPGINYRAHVISDQVFAVRLDSDELDYRYGRTTMAPVDLPADVAQRCIKLNRVLGLHFSGIDLMRTPEDDWYCFEVNTSPGFSYFEQGTGQPISKALARFMIDCDRKDAGEG
jgi:hypothetical protein